MTSKLDIALSRIRELSIIVMCGAITFAVLVLAQTPKLMKQAVSGVADKLDTRLFAKGGTMDKVDKIALHADKLVGEAANAAKAAAQASRDQQKFLKSEDGKLLATVGHVDDVVIQLGRNAQTVTDDLHISAGKLNSGLDGIPPLLKQGTKTLAAGETLISDSDIKTSFANVARATNEVANTTAHIDAMAADAQAKLHKTLNPSKKAIVWNTTLTLVKIGAALSPLY